MADIKLEGFDDFDRALKQAPQYTLTKLTEAVELSIKLLQGEAVPYPPATAANQPGRFDKKGKPMGYYERGRGWWYPLLTDRTLGGVSRYGKTRGVVRAPKGLRQQVRAYRLAKNRQGQPGTSERLQSRWDSHVYHYQETVGGMLTNNTSYILPVKGFKSGPPKARQAQRMAAIGWMSIEDDLEKVTPDIQAAFNRAMDDVMHDLAGGG
jgi:hypothetical protein